MSPRHFPLSTRDRKALYGVSHSNLSSAKSWSRAGQTMADPGWSGAPNNINRKYARVSAFGCMCFKAVVVPTTSPQHTMAPKAKTGGRPPSVALDIEAYIEIVKDSAEELKTVTLAPKNVSAVKKYLNTYKSFAEASVDAFFLIFLFCLNSTGGEWDGLGAANAG